MTTCCASASSKETALSPMLLCHLHHLPGTSKPETGWRRASIHATCMESLKSANGPTRAFLLISNPLDTGCYGCHCSWSAFLKAQIWAVTWELQESPLLSNSFIAAICCWQRGRGLASPKPPCIPQKGTFPLEPAHSCPPNPSTASTSRNWLRLKWIALKMSKNNTENHLNGSGQCPPWHSSVGSGPWRTSSTDVPCVPQQGVHALWDVSDGQADQSSHQDKLTSLCWQ